jgi:rRNA processing protein Krr1/Pno1
MGNRDCINNATKDKVFNFLKQIQEDWDKNHVV